MSTAPVRHATWPRVTLACYAREHDPDFAAALERASRQRYPGLEILGLQFGAGSECHTAVDALNELCTQAQGEYLLFFHPGEHLADDFLLHVVTQLKSQAEPPDFLYGTSRATHSGQVSGTAQVLSIPAAYADRNEFRELLRGPHFALGATIIRRGLFTQYGTFSTDVGTLFAWEFFLRVTSRGARGGFTPFAAVTESAPLAHSHEPTYAAATLRYTIELYDRYLSTEYWPLISGMERPLSARLEALKLAFAQQFNANEEMASALMLAQLVDRLRFLAETPEPVGLIARPLVSVIMTTCGERLPELERALRSVFAQTLTDVEIVLVQNGGASLAPYIAQLTTDARVRFVYVPSRLTAAVARNVALRLANGHYYAYLDEDNVFHPEHLATLTERITQAHADFTYCGANVHIHGTNGQADIYEREMFSSVNAHTVVPRFPTVNLNSVLHRARLAEETNFLDARLPILDDWFYVLCLLSGEKKTAVSPGATVDLHYTAPPSDSEFGRKGLADIVRAFDGIVDWVPLQRPEERQDRMAYRERLLTLAEHWDLSTATPPGLMSILKTIHGYDVVQHKNSGERMANAANVGENARPISTGS